MGEPVIRTRGLGRCFGLVVAVEGLDLEVGRGEIFGLLGPNGGGKTTTVRMLATLIAPTSGQAEVLGLALGEEARAERIRSRIGFLPEYHGLYDRLSAQKNLDFHAQLYGMAPSARADRIRTLLKALDVWSRKDDPVATFSRGMRQKIAIARAVVHDPELLFLDEPTANLDPESAKTVRDFILDLKKEKRTIILNTHNLDEAQRVCDRIAILNTKLMAIGSPEELERSVGVRKTVIQLEQVTDGILAALREAAQGNIEVDGNQVKVAVTNPERENATMVEAILRAGGRIQTIVVVGSTLEDAYLKLVRRAQ